MPRSAALLSLKKSFHGKIGHPRPVLSAKTALKALEHADNLTCQLLYTNYSTDTQQISPYDLLDTE